MIDIYLDDKHGILKNKLGITNKQELDSAEADILSLKICEIEFDNHFKLNEEHFKYIHKFLFSDLFDFAGVYRTIDMEKYEFVLNGLSVKYESYQNIDNMIKEIIKQAKNVDVTKLNKEDKAIFISDLMIDLWKVHAFREGNTRTVSIFICKYLESLGISFKNDIFKENASYIRKALVAASFEDKEIDIYANKEYILEIIKDILD